MKKQAAIALMVLTCFPFSLSENKAQVLEPPTGLTARPRNTISPSVEIHALQDSNPRVRAAAVAALAEIGPSGTEAIPALVAVLLRDPNAGIRWYAAYALAQMPSTRSIPALITALAEDSDPTVRANCAYALVPLGAQAKGAVPALIAALAKDRDATVRAGSALTLGVIGPGAKAAASTLIAALASDPDATVRAKSALALWPLGAQAKGAIPALIAALAKDPDASVRANSASALGPFGPEAKGAVPALVAALANDLDASVRASSARALWQMGPGAKQAIPGLIAALGKDPDAATRSAAAWAVLQLAPEAKGTATALYAALIKDHDAAVRLQVARALARLADAAKDNKRTNMVDILDQAVRLLDADHFDQEAKQVRADLDILHALQPPWYQVLYGRAGEHPRVVRVLAVYAFLALLWLVLFWISPLSLWKANEKLARLPETKLPEWLGGLEISLPTLILLSFFHYLPRVLDAWVSERIARVRDQFCRIATVRQREVHVDVPTELDGKIVPGLKADDLKDAFARKRTCLLIWGEGGSGKTSLACQVARWVMSDDDAVRPCVQRMLPILIEHDLDLEVTKDKVVLIEVIRGQLKNLTGEDEAPDHELLRHLLKQKRVLLVVDGISELSEDTRKKVRPIDPEFAAGALVVTSRQEEALDGVTTTTLHPIRIKGNRLSSFMEAYLVRRGRRALFDDTEFFYGCTELSAMVGDRDTTVLLAKLYAEQMVESKETTGENLPENIPDLMLQYLNDLNRNRGGLDDRAVHTAAKAIAWECLRQTYRPTPADIDSVLTALGKEGAEGRVKYLGQKLGLVQVIGVGRDRVKFSLDPLAEYLAGLYVVERCRDNEQRWREFLARADECLGVSGSDTEFLAAVFDCCRARADEMGIPVFVLEELGKRLGLDPKQVGRSWASRSAAFRSRLTPHRQA